LFDFAHFADVIANILCERFVGAIDLDGYLRMGNTAAKQQRSKT
jgi:hypothetical protein